VPQPNALRERSSHASHSAIRRAYSVRSNGSGRSPKKTRSGGFSASTIARIAGPVISGSPRRARARAGRGLPVAEYPPRTRPSAASQQSVQLFLAWLVHDSSSRRHTLARLRGAQAGFRLHGFRLDVPPSERVLDDLSGPGLNAPLVTAQTAARIRAGWPTR
jgi:hypothetical protein